MMNTIFEIIALPITLAVSAVCFFFAMIFESSLRTKNGVTVFKRIYRESHNLMLNRVWSDIQPLFKCVISAIIYYVIFF